MASLNRGGPIKRTPMKTKPSKRKREAQAAKDRNRPLLWERCGGRCECCGVFVDEKAWEWSHRRQDGAGGSAAYNQRVTNGLVSCSPFGCNYKISADADWQQRARDNGWIVHRGADPAALPVLLFLTGWSFLMDDGTVEPLDAAPLT